MCATPRFGRNGHCRAALKNKGRLSALGITEKRSFELLGAGLTVVGMIALGRCIGLRHVFTRLCLAVNLGAFTVVDVGLRVAPYFSVTPASRYCGRRSGFGRLGGRFG